MQDIYVAEIPASFDDDGEDYVNHFANKLTAYMIMLRIMTVTTLLIIIQSYKVVKKKRKKR